MSCVPGGWDYRDVHVLDFHQGMRLLLGSEMVSIMHDRNYFLCCYNYDCTNECHFNAFPSMVVRQPKGPDGTKASLIGKLPVNKFKSYNRKEQYRQRDKAQS